MNQSINIREMTDDMINATIAQLIGWKPTTCLRSRVFRFKNGAWLCKTCGNFSERPDAELNHLRSLPQFTTSMDAAWIIISRLALIDEQEETNWHLKMLFATQLSKSSPRTVLNFESTAYWTPKIIYQAFLRAYGIACNVEIILDEVRV